MSLGGGVGSNSAKFCIQLLPIARNSLMVGWLAGNDWLVGWLVACSVLRPCSPVCHARSHRARPYDIVIDHT